MNDRPAIVVAGPTASGKSGLALAIARQFNGVVVNADSMQVYDVLRVVTARPSQEDEALAPHRLYGVLSPAVNCSAALWKDMAAAEMEAIWQAGKLPVVVGGTGLYLRTLMHGISPAPDIPDEVRAETRALLAKVGNAEFHALLASRDPVMAARLDPANSQRLARAYEVLEASGRSLADWQALPMEGAVAARWLTLFLDPPRNILYGNCDRRFAQMVEQGALDEVRVLLDMHLDPALPAMKALGVPELAGLLSQTLTREQAIEQAQRATRNYAKRQLTWFRNQLEKPETLSTQLSERIFDEIFSKVRHFLLTPAK
ncbi:tRNA (adenosine(37)-N6)-dimethylallyltransferase MiaA [Magnetospirillum sp. 64-120]|uniref:tRNA (adenosine(37)-N6)-dimethylallyltransferase MiaA n=1 Tax=Magnetospirillum sp. 64-120 TaxID=1895778 RepID=UPI0009287A46|nr:tRNA (adenosine(37)-N6)-dimethylallyltransferase MiaA [Magnetospirillum sp. 64-120]OJX75186.1 MAG: tRNA (adenosine(37)-N6)-dimethylallyltransferase MiaA [Magnetospirillum sp. 64-120]